MWRWIRYAITYETADPPRHKTRFSMRKCRRCGARDDNSQKGLPVNHELEVLVLILRLLPLHDAGDKHRVAACVLEQEPDYFQIAANAV